MTRINLVPVTELTDQHLFAEFREIKMIPRSLVRSLNSRTEEEVLRRISTEFTLNKGHVTFFYDKGKFLRKRFKAIRIELTLRGYAFNKESKFDPDGVMRSMPWNNDYVPSRKALRLIRQRLAERIAMKPTWYRKTEYE